MSQLPASMRACVLAAPRKLEIQERDMSCP